MTAPSLPTVAEDHQFLYFQLKANKFEWTVRLIVRLIAVGFLICAIVFGASHIVFSLQAADVLGRSVNTDLQLALLGLINKIIDILVTISLEDFAAVILTLWFSGHTAVFGNPNGGIHLADFDLPQEMTKPWISIGAFHRRRTIFGWGKAGYVRFLVTLTTSTCVLLLALSINTVGMPKERWYFQDSQPYPSHDLRGIDTTYWGAGWNIVGDGSESWDAAKIYSATTTFDALRGLAALFGQSDQGWQQTGKDNDQNIVAINTDLRANVARGIALQTEYANEIFQWLQKNGTSPARQSIGWNAMLDLTVPYVTTSCVPNDPTNVTFVNQSAIVVEGGDLSPIFTVFVSDGLHGSSNTTTAKCELVVSRAIFPVDTWVVNSVNPALSVNNYGRVYNSTAKQLPSQSVDNQIASSLSVQLSIVLSILDNTGLELNSARIIRKNAQRLRILRPDLQRDEQAIGAVVTMLATTLLAYADWDMDFDYSQATSLTATGIKWQLYGSGPRLGWEWITVIVISVILFSLLIGIAQSLVYRLSASNVLKAPGMLVAANLSRKMKSISGSRDEHVLEKQLFRISNTGQGIIITDNQQGRLPMPLRKRYAWKQ